MAEGLRRERLAQLEFLRRADGMDAADEAADPLEGLLVAKLRRAAAAARIDGDAEVRGAQRVHGRDDGDLAAGELVGEGVLFVDLRVDPASGAVELCDHDRVVLEPDLVDAVLIAVQAEQPPVGTQTGRGHAVEHQVRRQARVGVRVHG